MEREGVRNNMRKNMNGFIFAVDRTKNLFLWYPPPYIADFSLGVLKNICTSDYFIITFCLTKGDDAEVERNSPEKMLLVLLC